MELKVPLSQSGKLSSVGGEWFSEGGGNCVEGGLIGSGLGRDARWEVCFLRGSTGSESGMEEGTLGDPVSREWIGDEILSVA